MHNIQLLQSCIRDIPDYPCAGIVFRDITPLLANPQAFAAGVAAMAELYGGDSFDLIAGVEARGFILAAPLATHFRCGLLLLRKQGKLPGSIKSISYHNEYSQDTLEISVDSVVRGARVLVVDDLIATGGTLRASCELLDRVQARVIGSACLIELTGLAGHKHLAPYAVRSVLSY